MLIFILVGGFKHFLFSISYMGCHPSHWRTHIFQDGEIAPPTSQYIIEIVIYPANFVVIFHSFLYVYQRFFYWFKVLFGSFSELFRWWSMDWFSWENLPENPMIQKNNPIFDGNLPRQELNVSLELLECCWAEGIRGSKLDRDVAFFMGKSSIL